MCIQIIILNNKVLLHIDVLQSWLWNTHLRLEAQVRPQVINTPKSKSKSWCLYIDVCIIKGLKVRGQTLGLLIRSSIK